MVIHVIGRVTVLLAIIHLKENNFTTLIIQRAQRLFVSYCVGKEFLKINATLLIVIFNICYPASAE